MAGSYGHYPVKASWTQDRISLRDQCCGDAVSLSRNPHSTPCFLTHTFWNGAADQFRPPIFRRLQDLQGLAFWNNSCARSEGRHEAGVSMARALGDLRPRSSRNTVAFQQVRIPLHASGADDPFESSFGNQSSGDMVLYRVAA